MKKDRWGYYYNMTGFEAIDSCFWCGKPVKNRRFCNNDCKTNYQNHFIWTFASAWCIERAGDKCEKCGVKQNCSFDGYSYDGDFGTRLEAHHISPLKGDTRHINKLNRPENLICLCHKCHNETRKNPEQEKSRLVDKQLELF